MDLTVAALKDQLVARLPELLALLAPGLRSHGAYWQGPNPTRAKDSGTSFTVWRSGAFKEFDAGEAEKGDVIGLIAYCRRCSTKEAFAFARDFLGLARMSPEERARLDRLAQEKKAREARAEEDRLAERRQKAFRLWLDASPLRPGSPVHSYLAHARGVDPLMLASGYGDLRQAAHLRHWGPRAEGKKAHEGPALVAPIREVVHGGVIGVHCTFVTADGADKAALSSPRLMLGQKKGGAVMIARGAENQPDLVVAEGIETALSIALAAQDLKVWAALDIGNIAALPRLKVRRLIVALENDIKPAALEARDRMLTALEDKGFAVRTVSPPRGSDFNDTWRW